MMNQFLEQARDLDRERYPESLGAAASRSRPLSSKEVERDLHVETYAGYRADERPLRFVWKGRRFEVIEIADRWYGPDHEYFKVRVDDGNTYILQHHTQAEQAEAWTVTSH